MSAGAYGRRAAARITTLWVLAQPRFGLDDSPDGPGFDEALMSVWCDTVGDDDMVWILGGLGDPEFVDGLPGRKYLVAGPRDPMSVIELPPDLEHRKVARSPVDPAEDAAAAIEHLGPIEAWRAHLVADYTARGDLAYVWTGYSGRYDDKRSMLRPATLDRIKVRGRWLTASGCVDDRPVDTDPLNPCLYRLEDVT